MSGIIKGVLFSSAFFKVILDFHMHNTLTVVVKKIVYFFYCLAWDQNAALF